MKTSGMHSRVSLIANLHWSDVPGIVLSFLCNNMRALQNVIEKTGIKSMTLPAYEHPGKQQLMARVAGFLPSHTGDLD